MCLFAHMHTSLGMGKHMCMCIGVHTYTHTSPLTGFVIGSHIRGILKKRCTTVSDGFSGDAAVRVRSVAGLPWMCLLSKNGMVRLCSGIMSLKIGGWSEISTWMPTSIHQALYARNPRACSNPIHVCVCSAC